MILPHLQRTKQTIFTEYMMMVIKLQVGYQQIFLF